MAKATATAMKPPRRMFRKRGSKAVRSVPALMVFALSRNVSNIREREAIYQRNVRSELGNDKSSGDEERQRAIARVVWILVENTTKQLKRIPDRLGEEDT